MPSSPYLVPTTGWLYATCAILSCVMGCHSTLLLASASLRLASPKLTVLTALLFNVQCVFSLHFIAMTGIELGQPWSFDIGLTAASFAVILVFGTAAVSLAIFLRQSQQAAVRAAFPSAFCLRPTTGRLGVFLLRRTPLRRLLAAVLLMTAGAAGCHHLGMWSMRGPVDALVTVELTPLSFLFTILIGGCACVAIVVAFIIQPEGHMRWGAAFLLAALLSMFHFTSAAWGLRYLSGAEGFSSGSRATVGPEAILLLVVAQGALSQTVSDFFSRLSIANYFEAQDQLEKAQVITAHIANMDLEPLKEMQANTPHASLLEKALFQVVANLDLYRPYLPDTLFINNNGGRGGDSGSLPSTSFRADKQKEELHVLSMQLDSTEMLVSPPDSPPSGSATPQGLETSVHCNMQLGLSPTRLTILRIALLNMDFEGGGLALEEALKDFMWFTIELIKAHRGTILSGSSGVVTAMWPCRSPIGPLKCAMAIQKGAKWPLLQLLQCGQFFAGNLATPHLRAFNVVGPLDAAGQQLLRLRWPAGQVLIMSNEREAVQLHYQCLPLERVLLPTGSPTTVYCVLPRAEDHAPQDEWMYEVAQNSKAPFSADLTECWDTYCQGQYQRSKEAAERLQQLPGWYTAHLHLLLGEALARPDCSLPTKSLEVPGWPREFSSHLPHPTSTVECFSVLRGAPPDVKKGAPRACDPESASQTWATVSPRAADAIATASLLEELRPVAGVGGDPGPRPLCQAAGDPGAPMQRSGSGLGAGRSVCWRSNDVRPLAEGHEGLTDLVGPIDKGLMVPPSRFHSQVASLFRGSP